MSIINPWKIMKIPYFLCAWKKLYNLEKSSSSECLQLIQWAISDTNFEEHFLLFQLLLCWNVENCFGNNTWDWVSVWFLDLNSFVKNFCSLEAAAFMINVTSGVATLQHQISWFQTLKYLAFHTVGKSLQKSLISDFYLLG